MRRSPSSRPNSLRPRIERLEDRSLLSAGMLDPTFGSGGLVLTDLGSQSDHAYDLAIQSDGKFVMAGDTISKIGSVTSPNFALVRYNSGGTLDTSFGTNGRVTTDFKGFGDAATAIALQADGKIIAAGNAQTSIKGKTQTDISLARYLPNGSLDATFGSKGKVVTTIGASAEEIRAMALQSDGKIVVAGYTNSFTGGSNFLVARYNTNGSLDSTFGTGGYVVTDFGGADQANSLAIQANGKIVLAGEKAQGAGGVFALARYNANGTLDNTFGSVGKVTTAIGIYNGGRDVAIQADGRIVVAGYYGTPGSAPDSSTADIALSRYFENGTLDPAFGVSGVVTLQVTGGYGASIKDPSVAIQTNGTIVVAGLTWNNSNLDFMLARLNADGNLDSTFGAGGVVSTDFGPSFGVTNSDDVPNAVRIQGDGKIVAAGSFYNPSTSGHDIALARYEGDAALQAAFIASNPTTTTITDSQVQPVFGEALARWQAAGVDTSAFASIDLRIADLGGTTLGLASGNTIWLDDNAAGWGWFLDSTPSDDAEFTTPGNQGEQDRMDLLTVLMHELGHVMGHDHDEDGVMAETLSAGTRLTLHGVDVQESWWLAGLPDSTKKRDAFSWWL